MEETTEIKAVLFDLDGTLLPMDQDYFGTFRNEKSLFRFVAADELIFCQPGVNIQFRCCEVGYFNNIWHKVLLWNFGDVQGVSIIFHYRILM